MEHGVFVDNNRHVCIVVSQGRTYTHAVGLDHGTVRMLRIEPKDVRYWVPAEYKGKPYPVRRAARALLRIGRALSITDKARSQLKGVLS